MNYYTIINTTKVSLMANKLQNNAINYRLFLATFIPTYEITKYMII